MGEHGGSWFTKLDSEGCPNRDPGFGQGPSSVMLASGMNCPAPKHCIPPVWLAQLQHLFRSNTTIITKDDLFQRDVCRLNYVERRGNQVLPYTYYRFGMHVRQHL